MLRNTFYLPGIKYEMMPPLRISLFSSVPQVIVVCEDHLDYMPMELCHHLGKVAVTIGELILAWNVNLEISGDYRGYCTL
jgi:hypothetical protein